MSDEETKIVDQETLDLAKDLVEDAGALAGLVVVCVTDDGVIRCFASGQFRQDRDLFMAGAATLLETASGYKLNAPSAAPNSKSRIITLK